MSNSFVKVCTKCEWSTVSDNKLPTYCSVPGCGGTMTASRDSFTGVCHKCGAGWGQRHRPECEDFVPIPPPVNSANATQEGGSHYKEMGVQPWDVIDTWPLDQRIGAYRAGALKYIMRMGSKDQHAQEIKKARHYCEKLVEVLTEVLDNARKED